MALNTGSHRDVQVVEEESALGEVREFLKCQDCGVRATLKNPGKFHNIDCEAYQRGTSI